MRRFKSAGHGQRFLSAFGIIPHTSEWGDICTTPRAYQTVMKSRFDLREEAICVGAIVS